MQDQRSALEQAEKHFGESNYGDRQRRDRTVSIAAAMAANPYTTLPHTPGTQEGT